MNSLPAEEEKTTEGSVWKDEDDEMLSASLVHQPRLLKLRETVDEASLSGSKYRERLVKIRSGLVRTPKWAEAAKQNDSALDFGHESYPVGDLDRSLNRSTVSDVLLPDYLSISKTLSIKVPQAGTNCLDSVEFHPQARSVLLSSGSDKNLHLFKVEGGSSDRLFSAKFKDMPIMSSHFSVDGQEILSTGRRSFFYCTDVTTEKVTRINGIKGRHEREWTTFCPSKCGKYLFLCGQNGTIVILCAKTKQWISNLTMNEHVTALCCSPDSRYLFSVGQSNIIYVWDLISLKCIKKFSDNGATLGTALAISEDSSLLACGGSTGIVNIYDANSLLTTNSFTPLKSYSNLVTPVSGCCFHPSSQILTMFSREKRNELRVVHYPSGRVYTNWPTERSPLGRVASMSYNCDGSSAAFASKDGIIQIYNIKHFSKSS